MDLDQRTRMLGGGGRSGRIILLGDGTEVMTDSTDNEAEMFDQSDEDDKDLENQVQHGQAQAQAAGGNDRNHRGETPGPAHQTPQQEANESKQRGTGPGSNPEEPKMMAATDSMPQSELKEKLDSK